MDQQKIGSFLKELRNETLKMVAEYAENGHCKDKTRRNPDGRGKNRGYCTVVNL